MSKITAHLIIFIMALNLFISSAFADYRQIQIKRIEELERGAEEKTEPLRQEVKYIAQGLRDPFEWLITEQLVTGEDGAAKLKVSVGSQVKPLPSLTVQGIIWGGVFPQAIINNQVVKANDVIESGVKIIDITKEGVKIFFDSRQYDLSAPAGKSVDSVKRDGGLYYEDAF